MGIVPNKIVVENAQIGNPASEWDISGAGDPSIQGFATTISVNLGETIFFKVNTDASRYHLDIYRLGYYNGDGARKVATFTPSSSLPQSQPLPVTDPSTGLMDYGNWGVSASWTVPGDATSGVYLARLVREDTGGASHMIFIVRDDDGHSDLLFQTSDTTWQAYNSYESSGDPFKGNSLYQGPNGKDGPYLGSDKGRAYKVSYNRPFVTRKNVEGFLFYIEYPMIRWLEANGYDVSYFTGVDSDLRGFKILEHKVFLSVGHDEYWSARQRANVEAARDAGVHLAFFSGNEVFWKTRWEDGIDSIDESGTIHRTTHRTLVCYKETHANAKIDPNTEWTGTWRDPRFSPPADGGHPENALTGTIFTVNGPINQALTVPAAYSKLRLWRNTDIASLTPGDVATFPVGTLGFEWDEDLDNGFRPAGLVHFSSTTLDVPGHLADFGSNYSPGRATHHLTLYRHSSGALVFGSGTAQWAWGLDKNHDSFDVSPFDPVLEIQQATVNLFADMGVQPGALQAGLIAASRSTDTTAPTSVITSLTGGSTVQICNPIMITGTASDADGVVGNVEVSVDGGTTWHPAIGSTMWSYTWIPSVLGSVTIKSRAVDESANLESPSIGVTVMVGPNAGLHSLFYDATNGQVSTGQLDSTGTYTNLKDYPAGTFGLNWTHIVAGTNNLLFFYDVANGQASTGQLDSSGTYHTLQDYPAGTFGPNWTYIVGTNGLLFFYNAANGQASTGQLDSSGTYHTLQDYPVGTFGLNWTYIVGTNNLLLFYNATAGQTSIGQLDDSGNYHTLQDYPTGMFGPNWTYIVGTNNLLFFYNTVNGQASTGQLDSTGTYTNLKDYPAGTFGLNWTYIVGTNCLLFFYNAANGQASTGQLDSSGTYTNLKDYPVATFKLHWTHIITDR